MLPYIALCTSDAVWPAEMRKEDWGWYAHSEDLCFHSLWQPKLHSHSHGFRTREPECFSNTPLHFHHQLSMQLKQLQTSQEKDQEYIMACESKSIPGDGYSGYNWTPCDLSFAHPTPGQAKKKKKKKSVCRLEHSSDSLSILFSYCSSSSFPNYK